MITILSLLTKKRLVSLVAIFSLLFQAQTVFACQMMDHSGPIEHCCCGEMAAHKQSDNDQSSTSGCCDISSELSFKASDLENEEPVAIQPPSSFEFPSVTLAFILTSLWPEITDSSSSPEFWDLNADPGSPGTATYLSTQRLRI